MGRYGVAPSEQQRKLRARLLVPGAAWNSSPMRGRNVNPGLPAQIRDGSIRTMATVTTGARAKVWSMLALAIAQAVPCAAAESDDADKLMRQVHEDPDYKVRLSAALRLGRQEDRRAVPTLLEALGDTIPSVRAVCADALAKLVDRSVPEDVRVRALAAAGRLAKTDSDVAVRAAANRAVQALEFVERVMRPRNIRNCIFIQVGPAEGASGHLAPMTMLALSNAARDELLAADAAIVTDWPGGNLPSAADLGKAKSRGAFAVLARLDEPEAETDGRRAHLKCEMKLVLASYPGHAIRSLASGAGGLESANRPEAIDKARRQCAVDVLHQVLKEEIIPAMRSLVP